MTPLISSKAPSLQAHCIFEVYHRVNGETVAPNCGVGNVFMDIQGSYKRCSSTCCFNHNQHVAEDCAVIFKVSRPVWEAWELRMAVGGHWGSPKFGRRLFLTLELAVDQQQIVSLVIGVGVE